MSRDRSASTGPTLPSRDDDERALRLLGDAGGPARALAQVVQLGAPHGALGHNLDLVDTRRVHREGPLHADAVRGLAHREGLAVGPTAAADHRPFEDLDAL